MCGIAGWLDFDSVSANPELLRAMTDSIYRRGPDGEGFHIDGPVHLGHRRLSIIDLKGGDQPITNEDETVWIVFNGEIFNFQELRSELIRRNHQFKTNSDTETIVHAYEEYGLSFVNHLRGQFAIAIWDKNKEQLVLARDRMGQKPLYYCETKSGIVFGSELKALLKHPGVSREIDFIGLDAFLAHRYIPEPFSIFRNVKKLLPAHTATFSRIGLATTRYWVPGFSEENVLSENEALEQLDSLLEESTRLRMIADVPLGAFLSGGIDSSLIVAYMSRISDRPIKTFNIGFEEKTHDESKYANQVAQQFETEHNRFIVKPDAIRVIPDLIQAFDEPFADSSSLAVYYLSKMTREHVKVALNGDGGDESFAGYRRYGSAVSFHRFQSIPKLFRDTAAIGFGVVNKLSGGRISSVNRFARWSEFQNCSIGEVYQRGVAFPQDLRNSILSDEVLAQLKNVNRFNGISNLIDNSLVSPIINRILEADQSYYLPSDLLVKVDRMTMWHSLEGRSPFLDHKIVEFAAGLNCGTKFPNGQLKHLLKKLALKFFPHDFVYRKKMGFGVPVANWFRGALKSFLENVIFESQLVEHGILNRSGLKKIYDLFLAGQGNYGSLLWAIINLEHWFRGLPRVAKT